MLFLPGAALAPWMCPAALSLHPWQPSRPGSRNCCLAIRPAVAAAKTPRDQGPSRHMWDTSPVLESVVINNSR